MKIAQRLLLVAVTVAALSSLSQAAGSIVGTWKGRIVMDTSHMAKTMSPDQQKMMNQAMAQLKTMAISLTFKANKTYSATATGGMMKKPDTQNGTWSQSGNVVTLVEKMKTGTLGKPEKFKLSADGKILTLEMPEQAGVSGRVIFKRG